jgi:SAM-dependent methyltransferase
VWASGAAYERYVGRWSRLVAREFLASLNVKNKARWLDVGCGTGALCQTILGHEPLSVTGIDASEAFVHHAKEQLSNTQVTFLIGDARALPFDDQTFDAVVSGLMLNFVPEPEKAALEMARVAKPNGTVAAYVWDYAGKFQDENPRSLIAHDQKDFHPGMEMMRYFWDAVSALNPTALTPDEGQRYPLCKPEPLTKLFENAGLKHVEVRAIDVATTFRDFDDYWSPFLGGQGPAPSYTMSLDEEARAALREYLRARLPRGPNGSIPLVARAWAVRGTRSS